MHIPVLLNEVITLLDPKKGQVIVDGTFGAGGYTRAILEKADCKVIAFDRDSSVTPTALEFKKQYGERFEFINDLNSNLSEHLEKADAVVFDFGVSSMQIDQPERGFSFLKDGPLDMRMNQGQGTSAEEVVNSFSPYDLADIIYSFGDERASRKIAGAIIEARKIDKITTTKRLAEIVATVLGGQHQEIHPATRTFQALRIYVNDELGEIKLALENSVKILGSKGKLLAVSFHSGESKIVKDYFNLLCGKLEKPNRHLPVFQEQIMPAEFLPLGKGTVLASEEEIKNNVRARSAQLRGVIRAT
ncbi:MAG: 16S rRNA (cytosine(1402)-N(4))-methyltransferase RsmH [Rickettsiales bacterium]